MSAAVSPAATPSCDHRQTDQRRGQAGDPRQRVLRPCTHSRLLAGCAGRSVPLFYRSKRCSGWPRGRPSGGTGTCAGADLVYAVAAFGRCSPRCSAVGPERPSSRSGGGRDSAPGERICGDRSSREPTFVPSAQRNAVAQRQRISFRLVGRWGACKTGRQGARERQLRGDRSGGRLSPTVTRRSLPRVVRSSVSLTPLS